MNILAGDVELDFLFQLSLARPVAGRLQDDSAPLEFLHAFSLSSRVRLSRFALEDHTCKPINASRASSLAVRRGASSEVPRIAPARFHDGRSWRWFPRQRRHENSADTQLHGLA